MVDAMLLDAALAIAKAALQKTWEKNRDILEAMAPQFRLGHAAARSEAEAALPGIISAISVKLSSGTDHRGSRQGGKATGAANMICGDWIPAIEKEDGP